MFHVIGQAERLQLRPVGPDLRWIDVEIDKGLDEHAVLVHIAELLVEHFAQWTEFRYAATFVRLHAWLLKAFTAPVRC